MEKVNEKGQWESQFVFLMATIGSAVGLGNLWGFPYKMGSHGGFAFLLIYLLLFITVGVAMTLTELLEENLLSIKSHILMSGELI